MVRWICIANLEPRFQLRNWYRVGGEELTLTSRDCRGSHSFENDKVDDKLSILAPTISTLQGCARAEGKQAPND
jgi:hypothetical protein